MIPVDENIACVEADEHKFSARQLPTACNALQVYCGEGLTNARGRYVEWDSC